MLSVESVKSSHLLAFKNVKKATLWDRLKQAGIKEMKPPKANKKGKKMKPDLKKYIYSKQYLENNCRNIAEIKKKGGFRLPDKNSVVSGKSSQSEETKTMVTSSRTGKCLSEDDEKTMEEKANETVIVSMDFIEDVQKYKKKIRSPKNAWEIKYEPYIKDECSSTKIISSKEEDSSKQQVKNDDNKNNRNVDEKNTDAEEFSETEKNSEPEYSPKQSTPQRKSQTEKESAMNFQLVQPFLNKLSSDDTAKIDKSYIQSLFTVAMYREKDKKTDPEIKKSEESLANEEQREKKAKISGKAFFNRKIKKKKMEAEEESRKSAAEMKKALESSNKKTTALLVRDLTKSEELQKENGFDCKGKPKPLNVTHSKPAVIATRRKRKFRHNFLKKTDKEFVETSFPGENMRAADVKELWRRESVEKSENSLSSHSSCTVPEAEENPGWKNLGLDSYKVLKKLVEEEVKKISNKSQNKEIPDKKINTTNLNGALKVKNCLKTPSENAKTESGRKLVTEVLDGKKKKAELLRRYAEDIPKEPGAKLKSIQKKEKTETKIPSKIIQDWNILNRLEQAFVALGSPTFPARSLKEANTAKEKKPTIQTTNQKTDSSADKGHADHLKDGKKTVKKREPLAKKGKKDSVTRLVSSNTKTEEKTVEKTNRTNQLQNKSIDINNKISVLREMLEGNTCKTEPERKPTQRNPVTKQEEIKQKTIIKLQDRRATSRVYLKTMEETTATTEKQAVRPKQKRNRSSRLLQEKLNVTKRYKKNSRNSKETLERQTTFSIVPGTTDTVPALRESESFIQTVEDPVQIIETNAQENQNNDPLASDLKEEETTDTLEKTESETEKVTNMVMEMVTAMIADMEMAVAMEIEKYTNETTKEVVTLPYYTLETLPAVSEKPEEEEEEENVTENIENLMAVPKDEPEAIPDNYYSHATNYYEQMVEEFSLPEQSQDEAETSNSSTVLLENTSSIFPIFENPRSRLLEIIQENKDTEENEKNEEFACDSTTEDLCKKFAENDVEAVLEICRRHYSNATTTSSTTSYDFNDIRESATNGILDYPSISTEFSVNSSQLNAFQIDQDPDGSKAAKNQTSWEQDIKIYRAIVTDILGQYNRISGFLKQNGYLNSLATGNGFSATTSKENQSNKSQIMKNLTEYRNKIIMEYQTLPIFEYKTRHLYQLKDAKKRSLAVAKDLKKDIDLDVKDYEVKVLPVIGSEAEEQETSAQPKGNGKEKNASLQDFKLSEKVKAEYEEKKQLRSFSLPITSLNLQTLCSTKALPTKENVFNLLSLPRRTCYPQTESETC